MNNEDMASSYKEFEASILEVCSQNPKGILTKNLLKAIPELDHKTLMECYKNLKTKIGISQTRDGLCFKLNEEDPLDMDTNEERLIYKYIKESGDTGIMAKDISYKTGLPLLTTNRFLQILKNRRFIKGIGKDKKKKFYFLIKIQPTVKTLGLSSFTREHIDTGIVDQISQTCLHYLEEEFDLAKNKYGNSLCIKHSFRNIEEICTYINVLGEFPMQLKSADIEVIMDDLVYNESAIRSFQNNANGRTSLKRYRFLQRENVFSSASGTMPCTICQHIGFCREGAYISPTNCQYMKEWLA